jgi:uncharacterized protein YmfQ (DUF2313 family)
MANFALTLPGEESDAGEFARQLATILGTAYQPADGTVVAADLYALGQALADASAINTSSVAEAFADTASALLSELEVAYGLTPRHDATKADRRAALRAKIRAARAGTPQAILRAVTLFDVSAVVHENTAAAVATAAAAAPTTADALLCRRHVFVWAVEIAAAVYADSAKRTAIRAIVQQMKPAHTRVNVCTQVGFYCDDPNSLVDRDVLGS